MDRPRFKGGVVEPGELVVSVLRSRIWWLDAMDDAKVAGCHA